MRFCYLNGDYIPLEHATVHVSDRGFLFADGIYDVAAVRHGQVLDWPLHWQRLNHSLKSLDIQPPLTSQTLRSIIEQLVHLNACQDAFTYVQITRGAAPRDHAFPQPPPPPTVLVQLSDYFEPSNQAVDTGVQAISLPDIRWQRRDIKSIALLANVMAKQKAQQAGAEEAIFVESDDTVTEGSSSNVFIVDRDNKLLTHPANQKILSGITRFNTIQAAQAKRLEVIEQAFSLTQLLQAREVFVTATKRLIMPVIGVDGRMINQGQAGPITKQLRQHLLERRSKKTTPSEPERVF